MSGISINKFQEIDTTQNVVVGEDKKNVDTSQRGNLFGKFVNWLTRDEAKKTANNEISKAFFDSLEKTYGQEVKDFAVEGYEGRLSEGKPLSGYRIQQILERARVGQGELSQDDAMTVKARLFTQKAPEFVREALQAFDIPDDKRQGWEDTLVARLGEPQLSQGRDPLTYDDEFRDIVRNFIETNRQVLENVGRLEAKRQNLNGHEGCNWEHVRPSEVEEFAFPTRGTVTYRDTFLQKFGEGDGKTTNDLETYFHETMLPGAKDRFVRAYGNFDPEGMKNYDNARGQNQDRHNGAYRLYGQGDSEFLFVQRMDCGRQLLQEEQVRGEKFHISIRPEDMGKVFEALGPILSQENSPIPMWKAVDVDMTQKAIDELTPQRNQLQTIKDEDPEDFTQEQQDSLDRLNRKIGMAQRLQDSCQITLYLDPNGQVDDPRVPELLKQIETTLGDLGIDSPGTPGSDEPVGQFVSFRLGQVTYNEDDPGYKEAFDRAKVKSWGEPITERIDPQGEDYHQIKTTFRDNPNYLAQVGVVVDVHMGQIERLGERLDRLVNDREARARLDVDLRQAGGTISQLNLSEQAKQQLTEAYLDLVRRQAGVSQRSSELMGSGPTGFEGFVDEIRTSTLDDLVKVNLEQLVTLTGRLMMAASDRNTPVEDRLRIAGELESLHDQIGSLLTSQFNDPGYDQELVSLVRTVPFRPNLGDIHGMFQQANGDAIPDDPEEVSRMFRALGVALESLDRLPLIPEEREELDQLVDELDTFLEYIGPRPGSEASVAQLSNGIERLRAEIARQLGT